MFLMNGLKVVVFVLRLYLPCISTNAVAHVLLWCQVKYRAPEPLAQALAQDLCVDGWSIALPVRAVSGDRSHMPR